METIVLCFAPRVLREERQTTYDEILREHGFVITRQIIHTLTDAQSERLIEAPIEECTAFTAGTPVVVYAAAHTSPYSEWANHSERTRLRIRIA